MLFDFGDSGAIPKLSAEYFTIFRDFICERSGIRIRENRVDYLEYRLKERMLVNSITDYREYYYKLKYEADGTGSEFQELINLITVHETSFFRHPDQLDTLSDVVMKRIISDKDKVHDFRLKLWSAVCSTGEEPLTIAMILKEKFPHLKGWNFSILASDISTRAIEKAEAGLYTENSFRTPLDQIKAKYFKKVEKGYLANEEIRKMVSYRRVNLKETDSLGLYQGMDIILCRNVFIYFPEEVKHRIAEKFYELLNRGGALILGNAEVIDVKKIPFKLEFHRGGPVYLKV